MTTVKIELISDYICPWCYLGETRIERIKEKVSSEFDLDIKITPFLLYPDIPKGGLHKSHFASKTKHGMGKALKEEAIKEGIRINYKNIEKIPNSLEAHRLNVLISESAKQFNFSKRVFRSYFQEGQDIENKELLSDLALNANVSQNLIDIFNQTSNGSEECELLIKQTKEENISLVPSIRIDNKLLMPGLQPEEIWTRFFKKAAQLQSETSS